MPEAEDEGTRAGLLAAVAARLGPVAHAGPLQRNYFSLILPVDLQAGDRVMVKVPRTDLRARAAAGPLPLTEGDRQLGRAEYDSLSRLSEAWAGDDVRVRWVKPVAYLEDVNAVVTGRVDAGDVCGRYRRLALGQLAGHRPSARRLCDAMGRIGRALGRYHRRGATPAIVDGATLAGRVRQYIDRVQAQTGSDAIFDRARATCDRLATRRWTTTDTDTLKGIDIRNVLEAGDGALWLLDPGRTKRTAREADLSRFLLTWRILFQGSPWFAARAMPHRSTEQAFCDAYWDGGRGEAGALHAYVMKEVLKHWDTAIGAVAGRGWPAWLAGVVRRGYVDAFYRARLAACLDDLS